LQGLANCEGGNDEVEDNVGKQHPEDDQAGDRNKPTSLRDKPLARSMSACRLRWRGVVNLVARHSFFAVGNSTARRLTRPHPCPLPEGEGGCRCCSRRN